MTSAASPARVETFAAIGDVLGERAYEAWRSQMGGKDNRGEPLPGWGGWAEPVRQAWRVAAAAAAAAFLDVAAIDLLGAQPRPTVQARAARRSSRAST